MCSIIYEPNKGLGGAGVLRACRNGHGSCDNLSSGSIYDLWSFWPVTKFLHTAIAPQQLTSAPCASMNELKVIRGTCKAPN